MPQRPPLPLRFGRALRLLRAEKDLSQEALAHEAGISRTYLGEIERGERCPSICVAAELADALGMASYDLLRAAEDMGDWLGQHGRAR
jgi:XRE family transcriptional regulator, regulator of sulfur utilization